jgi:hypothetical protein
MYRTVLIQYIPTQFHGLFCKNYAKQQLNKTKSTFPFKFDQLMQRSNYNETNGIIIGPELSRIFAEIIMQSVDNNIINDLNKEGLVLGEITKYIAMSMTISFFIMMMMCSIKLE